MIKMRAGFAGVDFSVAAREETSRFSANEEARMVAAGYADYVGEPPTADQPPAEQPPADVGAEAAVVLSAAESVAVATSVEVSAGDTTAAPPAVVSPPAKGKKRA